METETRAVAWRGAVESYVVGDAGRAAARVVPVPDPSDWNQPDTVLDAITLVDGRTPLAELRAASVRGLSHRAYGRVRQDEYGYRRSADGRYLTVCVADGVSTGKLSHRAAKVAVNVGTKWLLTLLAQHGPDSIRWGDFVRGVAARVEEQGRKLLRRKGMDDADSMEVSKLAQHMATTVLFAVVDLQAIDGAFDVYLLAVGDSSAWVLREGGKWEPQDAVKNEGAEVYSSSVQALPMMPTHDPAPVRTSIRPGEALVLMTDGIGDPLGNGGGEVGGFLADVWATPPASGVEFAAQIGFARKSFDDDRTAVAVWPVA